MLPILYSTITEGTVPSSYGVGVLSDCLSYSVKEVRNGEYELTMEYPSKGIHAESIVPMAFIKAKPNFTDDPQLFQIYKVGKTINGHFTVNAEHASYLLSGKVITNGTAGSCTAACALLTAQAGNFTITTDKAVAADFNIDVPSSVRSWFGGKKGSILDVYGPGEWKYDNFSAEFLASRGQDRGVTIRYGKNLTELSQTLDMSNLVSSVIPYYKDNDGNVTTGSAVSTGLAGITKEIAVDFSSSVDPESATPIATQLASLAASYVANNNLTQIKNSITLDFVQMKDLAERVDLCDTVHIYFEPLGITATAKCIETVWDGLAERYISTTFGDPKTNITDTIVATQKAVEEKPSVSQMKDAAEHASEKITGNLGGYVVFHDSDNDGQPDEILIMDTPDITTAVKVWRFNNSGLGYSGNGYAGPYDKIALTDDGQIVATAITTGTLNANLIKAGVISDVQGNSTIDMTNGEAKMKDFNAKNNFKLLDANGDTKAWLSHNSSQGSTLGLFNTSGQRQVNLAAGVSGALHLANTNGDYVVVCYADDNDNSGHIILNDASTNTADVVIQDNNGNPSAVMKIDGGRGYFESYSNGSIMSAMRCNANGGVVDVYDTQYLQIQLIGNGGVVRCVTVQQTSSRKVKENIKPMEAEEARKILDLEAVSFDYKNKSSGTNKRGFIAEDVAEVLPNLVTAETEELPASLDYIGMIPYLQAVIKEQEKRIEALEKKIGGLK